MGKENKIIHDVARGTEDSDVKIGFGVEKIKSSDSKKAAKKAEKAEKE